MLIIFALLCLATVLSMKINLKGFNDGYLSVENTQAVKGIFIIIVFMSHIRSYGDYSTEYDALIIKGINYLGQLMVAMFLFYSGYGINESIKRKGKPYIDAMPKNRIYKTFKDFALAIILFLLVDIMFGQHYSWKHILLAFTGWTSIGNSNWYMFAIFTLYIITYLCFKLFYKHKYIAISAIVALSLVYIFVIQKVQGGWWCDTYLCYVAGMLYSCAKDRIEHFMKKIGTVGYLVVLLAVTGFYFAVADYRHGSIMYHNIVAIIFCMVIVVFTMRVSIRSKLLIWCGKNLFWLYILQRIPMFVLSQWNINSFNVPLFTVLCAAITVVLSIIIVKAQGCIDNYQKRRL